MSSTAALQGRLKELSASLGQLQPLLERLRNFTASIGQGDEARVELGSEIHSQLKDAEEELELLRVDVETLESTSDNRKKSSMVNGEKEAERERVIAMARRLADELKKTRGEFRNAQLQAKRNAELAKRKERELLLSRSQSPSERQRHPSEKFTQDDLVLNASNDVTAALRRTHNLMQAELSRSQFAQETLEQSTAAISSLSESYNSLDTLLASSRSLASSLLRSQKSDTWYLETAFYILVGTITWLLFRRILYGPMWWLVWLPFKFALKFVFATLGAVGLTKGSTDISSTHVASEISATMQQTAAAISGQSVLPRSASWEDQPSTDDEDRLIDQIGKMVEEGKQEGTGIDDISPEERQRQAELPRNTKKRMFEAEPVRDEL